MTKPVIVLADVDEEYITALEEKFIEELREKVELEIITEQSYFEEYFKRQTPVEVLVVGEQLFFHDLEKNNIKNIFVLQENMVEAIDNTAIVKHVLKYSSTNKIYQQVIGANSCLSKICSEKHLSKTKVIVVYSPIGGVGKTTLALGMGSYMSKGRKVLYINAERMNTFQYFFNDVSTIPNNVGMELGNTNSELYAKIKGLIATDALDYLLPFGVALSSLNLDYSIYNKIIESVKEADEYDYIIIDADTVFDMTKAVMLAKADTVILVGNQDEKTNYVMNILKKNMVYDNPEKYFYVCNCYEENKSIFDEFDDFIVSDNVRKIEHIDKFNLKLLAEEKDIQKISLLVM